MGEKGPRDGLSGPDSGVTCPEDAPSWTVAQELPSLASASISLGGTMALGVLAVTKPERCGPTGRAQALGDRRVLQPACAPATSLGEMGQARSGPEATGGGDTIESRLSLQSGVQFNSRQ